MPGGGGQPFAGAFSKDEIQRLGSVKKFVFLVKNGSFLVRIQI